MNPCLCSGNNSLRESIGAIRCECGGPLNDAQIRHRIISRLNDLDAQVGDLMEAVKQLGVNWCQHCGSISRDAWVHQIQGASSPRCWCLACLKADPSGPITEDDDEETVESVAGSIVRFLTGRGITSLPLTGPTFDAYLKIAR